jgi:hypothetical protein
MCSEQEFIDFEASLSDGERKAIEAWLGVWSESICIYQRSGEGDQVVVRLESNLRAALSKAVVCRRIIYRGLSDRFLSPDRQQYMRRLLLGPEIFTLDCHASASVLREIGEGFTFTEPDDDERTLSVLLQTSSKTGRYLKPFRHGAKDEGEVVLLRGSRYRRIFAERKADPKPNLEYWVMQVEEIV